MSGHRRKKRTSEADSLSGDSRRGDLSGHGKKQAQGGELTGWRGQREKACQDTKISRPDETHLLPRERRNEERGTCQDTERNKSSEAISLSEDGRRQGLSEHGTWIKADRARLTYILEMAEGETCQDMKTNTNETHSLAGAGDGRGRHLS